MSNSYYTQHMLLQYGRQLTAARRLALYRQAMRSDEDPVPFEQKRAFMVERVTSEIVDNLFLSGSDNPVVAEVRERLDQECGEKLTFRYPPGELDMRIFRETDHGLEEIMDAEKAAMLSRLRRIAHEVVNATML